jgi:hypothetical protein
MLATIIERAAKLKAGAAKKPSTTRKRKSPAKAPAKKKRVAR